MTSPNPAIRGTRAGRFTWEGATVLRQWGAQIEAGIEAEAEEIEADLKQSIHRSDRKATADTPHMADAAYARVEVRGTKRTIVAGSTAPHTFYEEVAPNNHPVIRTTMDRHAPHVTRRIAAARRGR